MPTVLVVADHDPLTDRLVAQLQASAAVESCGRADGDPGPLLTQGGCDTVVYAAAARAKHRAVPDLDDARAVFALTQQAGVRHLVVLSSAAVNEPSAHNLNLLCETRLAARRTGNTIPDGWLALEAAAEEAAAAGGARLTVLRPCPVVTPGGRDFWSRLFRRRLAWSVLGFDPTLQLLAPADLAQAVEKVVAAPPEGAVGVYNVAPRGVIPLRRALQAAGTLRLPLPWSVHWLLRRLLAPLGLMAPLAQLDALRYPATVDDGKIRRALGYAAATSSYGAVRRRRPRRAALPEVEPVFDDFGLDEGYIGRLGRTLFRFLHDVYWRIEVRDLERVPRSGPVVLTGVHRGFQPWDGVMAMYLLMRRLGRCPRFLIHPTLVKFPFLAPYMIKLGGIPACQENADWVLSRGGIAAVFPEGIRGAFRRYKDVYRLGKFGREEYVKMALRHQAPIVPFVTVGSAEIYPIFAKVRWRWWQRYSEWPCLPVTPTLGLVPLPSKWHTWFLEPLEVAGVYPPEAAEDRATVEAISREVRRRMEAAFAEMLRRRRSIFYGSIFDDEAATERPLAREVVR